MTKPKPRYASDGIGAISNKIGKWFGDLEVVEAEKELRIQPNMADIKSAVKDDPLNCVFSRTCQRMWGSSAVVFFGTVAYVDLLDKNGDRRLERFNISSAGQRLIRSFDAGDDIKESGFTLLPPSKRQTAASLRKAQAALKKKTRDAILKGSSVPESAPRPRREPSIARLSKFRNGTGMAQFPPEA
jgi:hypothetical protein